MRSRMRSRSSSALPPFRWFRSRTCSPAAGGGARSPTSARPFDVHGLLSNEGIDDGLRAAFVVYLVSHHRPIERLLAPAPAAKLR